MTKTADIDRTPRQIIGDDAYMQLIFEGYEVVKSDELSRRSEVIARAKEVRKALQLCVDMIVANGLERGLQNTLEVASAALSSKESELE